MEWKDSLARLRTGWADIIASTITSYATALWTVPQARMRIGKPACFTKPWVASQWFPFTLRLHWSTSKVFRLLEILIFFCKRNIFLQKKNFLASRWNKQTHNIYIFSLKWRLCKMFFLYDYVFICVESSENINKFSSCASRPSKPTAS